MSSDALYFYDGVGNVSYSDILPPRTVSDSIKESKSFKIDLLDRLEYIGFRQFAENLKYRDYFKMVKGELVYADLMEGDGESLRDINTVRAELDLPTWLRHYDIIGDACNTILGEWLLQKDKFRFDTADEVTTNEYIREQTDRLQQFAQVKFEIELRKKFAERGIDPDQEFQTPEEQQQYLAQLEQMASEFIPENIKNKMRNWKTLAADWAEKTYERDHQRFKMDLLEAEEGLNKILVGVAPRHYLVGYDYYKPESWNPINTFYSKDPGIKFIQDAEFAGRVHFMPVHEIIERYGHKLTSKQIEKISESFTGKYIPNSTTTTGNYNLQTLAEKNFLKPVTLPFKGADDYALQLQFQDAFNSPMGTMETVDGNVFSRSLPNFDTQLNYTHRYASALSVGQQVRSDVIQVTEAYVKCYKKIGILTYRTDTGYLDTAEVDEDLLKDFIEEYEIKKITNVSLEEAIQNPKENTIVYTYIPKIYSALKIKTSSTFVGEDIYFLEPLKYQIQTGTDSNYYDFKLPVFGHIETGIAELMRPFQVDYNFVMNENKNLMEKELGMFFMLDVNFLPSEFMDLTGDSKDILTEMYNTIKEIGILPIDASKGNLSEKGGVQFNSLMAQNVTFTPQIQRNIQLAQFYKQEAFSRIGITPPREGAPTTYETATGVRMTQNAGYSKTMNIFQNLLYDKQCKIEGHLAIAQYCQLNQKDANYTYRAGDDELIFLQSIKDDENFSLRRFGVYPTMDASKRREFETLKQVILSRNTMNADELALAEIIYSDDYQQLKEAAINLRKYQEAQAERAQQNQQQQTQQLLEQQERHHQEDLQLEYAKLDNKLESQRIEAIGYAGRSESVENPTEDINRAADRAIRQQSVDDKRDLEYEKLRQNYMTQASNVNLRLQELNLRKEQLNQRERERATKELTSIINPS